MRFFIGHALRSFAGLAFILATGSTVAHAGFVIGNADQFGLLYEGNGGKTLSYNNSNETGNIGIGATGKFQGNGPGTINGDIVFSAANTGQYSNSGLTLVPAVGNPAYSNALVTNALTTANQLSHDLGLEPGTNTTITTGGSINAVNGLPVDASGDHVFTVTSINFPNGTFTINGTATDYVVLNIAGSVGNNGLNGSVVLSGGITPNHVLFNYTPSTSNLTTYNNDYATLSGGPTMTISTNGLLTTGTFLDPTGNFQINHCDIFGRIIGGDTQNSSFVSGANLTAPAPDGPNIPEPSSFVLAALGFAGLVAWRRRKR
jgi:MYXO-CTERM domain-containing protein